MKRFHQLALLTGIALSVSLAGNVAAQEEKKAGESKGGERKAGDRNRGNFNMEEFRQRMAEQMKERFEVKNDDEWKIISERIEKVSEVRRESMGGFGGFGGGTRGGPPGGGTTGGGAGGTRTVNPDVDALQKAIEAKAPADELKAKMEGVRRSRKVGEEKLVKAQDDLRAVLTVRQEAQAMLMGLLQ